MTQNLLRYMLVICTSKQMLSFKWRVCSLRVNVYYPSTHPSLHLSIFHLFISCLSIYPLILPFIHLPRTHASIHASNHPPLTPLSIYRLPSSLSAQLPSIHYPHIHSSVRCLVRYLCLHPPSGCWRENGQQNHTRDLCPLCG